MRPASISAQVTSDGELAFSSPAKWQEMLKRFTGVEVRITIEPRPRQRSLDQNARYHAALVRAFSEWSGYERDEAHLLLRAMFLSVEESLPDGTVVSRARSTTELTVEEFTEFMDRIERFLAQNEVGVE